MAQWQMLVVVRDTVRVGMPIAFHPNDEIEFIDATDYRAWLDDDIEPPAITALPAATRRLCRDHVPRAQSHIRYSGRQRVQGYFSRWGAVECKVHGMVILEATRAQMQEFMLWVDGPDPDGAGLPKWRFRVNLLPPPLLARMRDPTDLVQPVDLTSRTVTTLFELW